MLLFTLASLTVALCTPVGPTPIVVIEEAGRHLTRGVVAVDENLHVHIRREVHDLKDNFPDQWSLYLLGLQAFQAVDQDDPLSFYRIAGIHGRPYEVWQDAQGREDATAKNYCPHENTLFLTWHRAYLALFEQELYNHIQKIAFSAPPEQGYRWSEAAYSFRIPYWEWALGDSNPPVPDFFTAPEIQVTRPDTGELRTIANPLFQYKFHPLYPHDFDWKYASMNTTVRWPVSEDPSAPSQNDRFAQCFAVTKRACHDDLSPGFELTTSLNDFSYRILEKVHGYVHFCVGGNNMSVRDGHEGNMWPIEYSAFDPLFWLHHAEVDRLFALWQAKNPDYWITPKSADPFGNFVLAPYQNITGDTPIAPFWKTSQKFWTSDDIRDTTVLGYTYPELQPWKYPSDDAYRAAVNAIIAQDYSSSVRKRLKSDGQMGGELSHLLQGDCFDDWTIDANVSHTELPSTFKIQFSLVGLFASDPAAEVGSWIRLRPSNHSEGVRRRLAAAHELNGMGPSDQTLGGSISLTASLLDQVEAGHIASLQPSAVVPFLKERLTWNIFAGDGSRVPNAAVQSLVVQVVSRKVRIPDNPTKPLEYGSNVTMHPEATEDKGGAVQS